MSLQFKGDNLKIEKTYVFLYMGMIAENRKVNTRLGKRIKRLGVHEILIDNLTVNYAANNTRGIEWEEIDIMCKKRGF